MKYKLLLLSLLIILCTSFVNATWWNVSYDSKRTLNCTNMNNGIPLVINGSGGFDIAGDNQIVWTACQGETTAVYYNKTNSSSYVVANNTLLPFEVELGNGTSYTPTLVWGLADRVYHFNGDCVDSMGNTDCTKTGSGVYTGSGIGQAYQNPSSGFDQNLIFGAHSDVTEWIAGKNTTYMWRWQWLIESAPTQEMNFPSHYDGSNPVIYEAHTTTGYYYRWQTSSGSKFSYCDISTAKSLYNSSNSWWIGLTVLDNGTVHCFANDHPFNSSDVSGKVGDTNSILTIGGDWYNNRDAEPFIFDEFRIYQDIPGDLFQSDYFNQTYNNLIGTAGYGDLGAEESQPVGVLTLTIEGFQRNITVELGSILTVSATITEGDTVCIDVDHPAYGTNYSCEKVTEMTNVSCYQETANISTICGGLSTGTYSYDAAGSTNPTNVVDGIWTTYGSVLSYYINYSKPTLALSSSLWQVKDSSGGTRNLSLTSPCWNYDADTLALKIEMAIGPPGTSGNYSCYNGTDYELLYTGGLLVYEEAMWWVIPSNKFELDIDYYDLTTFSDETSTKTISGDAQKTLNVSLDNRSDIISAYLELNCSTSYCENVTINMTGYNKAFMKGSNSFRVYDTYYEDPWFKYLDTYYKLMSYTYPVAGTVQILFDVPDYPTYVTFNVDAADANYGNLLNRYDWFNTTDKTDDDATYGSTENVTSQLAMFDNMGTNTTNKWTKTESRAMGTYDKWEWNNDSSPYYLELVTRVDTGDYVVEWRQAISTYLDFRNHSMIEFRVRQASQGGTGVRRFVGATRISINDGSTNVYIASHEASANVDISLLENYTLIRTTPSSNIWKVYIDNVYSTSISTSTLDSSEEWNLQLYTSARAQVLSGDSGVWGNTNLASIRLYYIKKGGIFLAKNATYGEYNSSSGTFISENLTTQSNNIDSATLNVNAYLPTETALKYYLMNNDTWEAVNNNILHGFTSTGKNLSYRIDLNTTNASISPEIYDVHVTITPQSLENLSIYSDAGVLLWNKTGQINASNTPLNISLNITGYSPGEERTLIFQSDSAGVLNISNFAANSTLNPITLIDTTFEDQTLTQINVSYDNTTAQDLTAGISVYYIGGNKTYTVLAHDDTYTNNDSYEVRYSYSSFNLSLPTYVDYEEFIPQSPTSKNVTPYKQTSSTPIYNISITGYAGAINLSFNLNETHSCVNITYDTDSNKAGGQQLAADTWYNVVTNQVYGYNFGVWLWEDYGCNRSYWDYWDPWLSIRPCCAGCDVCSQEVE